MRMLRRGLVIAVVVLSSGEINRDEYLCEEAHAKLKQCCGAAFATETSFCTLGACSSPSLGASTSECILGLTCEEIVKNEICRRVMRRDETGVPEGVCP